MITRMLEYVGVALIALALWFGIGWPLAVGFVGLYLLVSSVLAQVWDREKPHSP